AGTVLATRLPHERLRLVDHTVDLVVASLHPRFRETAGLVQPLIDHAGTFAQFVLGARLQLLEIHDSYYLLNRRTSSQPCCVSSLVSSLPHPTPFVAQRQPPQGTLTRTWCGGDEVGATRGGCVGSAALEPLPMPG